MNKTMRQNISACAALGMSYWADHPAPACVWAVDAKLKFHAVRIDRRNNRVEDTCGYGRANRYEHSAYPCRNGMWDRPFTTVDTLDEIAALLAATPHDDRIEVEPLNDQEVAS